MLSQAPDFTGSGKFIQQLILQSRAMGHENFLFAGVQADFNVPADLIEKERTCFVRFDGVDLPYPIPGMSDVMPYPSTVFSSMSKAELGQYKKVFKHHIKSALERFQPDLIHTHHLWLMSSMVRELAPEIPMVTTCHGTCLRQHHLCPRISEQIKEQLTGIDAVIALSSEQKNKIMEVLGINASKIKIISGGFDESCFYFKPKKDDDLFELSYAGKLSQAKGLPWLLKSLKKIDHLPFRLHIAGSASGQEKERCLNLADTLKDKCVYHGMLSHSELGDLLRRSHAFILPSFFEGLPLVLMEALACGCQIVATALPGVKELFADTDTRFIHLVDLPELETIDQPFKADEPMLENRLAKILEKVISARRTAGQAGISRLTGPYTWEKVFSRVNQVYGSLVS